MFGLQPHDDVQVGTLVGATDGRGLVDARDGDNVGNGGDRITQILSSVTQIGSEPEKRACHQSALRAVDAHAARRQVLRNRGPQLADIDRYRGDQRRRQDDLGNTSSEALEE